MSIKATLGYYLKAMPKYTSIILLSFVLIAFSSYAQRIETLQQGNPTSIRGLSVVDDNTAWISGSKGNIAITTDGGKTWNWQQVKGFEKADFRDIEAFSDKEAIIMSSGTPALILKTTNGGVNWQVKYKNTDTSYFLDAMDFSDKQHGYVLGDPINNKFVLLETKDGGETWNPFKDPPVALPGEAAFAASGTCLKVVDKNTITIVTGGTHSRDLTWVQNINTVDEWSYIDLPFSNKKQSEGIFSYACNDKATVYVGGDYTNDKRPDSTAMYWQSDGSHVGGPVHLSKSPPAGFQSCVEYISGNTFLSTGTPGSNITTNGGQTWTKIDATSYNVCRKAKHGKLVLLAGNGGKIGIFKL
ncbi:MAG: Ycf48-like protein precursor [Mucilaginibacter sp.]|nr:Ycf48-like protein precursor [Mucilaginibacter sp.]